ncbi:MAG: efflux transporter outer membrane subunit [Verrucomicrobiota bacterium]
MQQTNLTIWPVALLLLPLSGCFNVYTVREEVAPSVEATSFVTAKTSTVRQPGASWWIEFENPQLSELIDLALSENFSIATFEARIREAEAVARQTGAERLPQLDIDGDAGQRANNAPGLGDAIDDTRFATTAGLAASWEIDLFGRITSARKAALREVEATDADLEAARLSLSARVATEFYRAVEQRLLLVLLEAQAESDEAFLELTKLRFRKGVTDRVDVVRQQALLAETRSLIPLTRASLREAENSLDALLGGPADAKARVTSDFPVIGKLTSTGVPADLILYRPDLRALQLRLEAIDFETAEAIADRLPRLQLTAALDYASGPETTTASSSALAGILAPILDGGRRAAVVNERQAEYDAALAEFTEAFLGAIAEVENLLFRSTQQNERVEQLAARVGFLREALELSRDRYDNGLVDFLAVLTALEDLQDTERELIDAQGEQIQLRIDLQRAIGGSLGTENASPLSSEKP